MQGRAKAAILANSSAPHKLACRKAAQEYGPGKALPWARDAGAGARNGQAGWQGRGADSARDPGRVGSMEGLREEDKPWVAMLNWRFDRVWLSSKVRGAPRGHAEAEIRPAASARNRERPR